VVGGGEVVSYTISRRRRRVRYRGKQVKAARGGNSPGKRESGGGCFEYGEVPVAPTVGSGREAKGRTEKRHVCAFWGKGGEGGRSGTAVGRGSRKGEGNGGADLAIMGGKKEWGVVRTTPHRERGAGPDRQGGSDR
jgi:hypothetical protein